MKWTKALLFHTRCLTGQVPCAALSDDILLLFHVRLCDPRANHYAHAHAHAHIFPRTIWRQLEQSKEFGRAGPHPVARPPCVYAVCAAKCRTLHGHSLQDLLSDPSGAIAHCGLHLFGLSHCDACSVPLFWPKRRKQRCS